MKKSVMITGASCTGKSTVIDSLIEKVYLTRVPGFTTRAPRKGEISGFDFLYISDDELRDMFDKGDLIDPNFSVTGYGRQRYGSPRAWVDMPLAGSSILFSPTSTVTASHIKRTLGEIVIWVHLFAGESVRRNRLMIRGISAHEVNQRLHKGDSLGIIDSADFNLNTGELGTEDVVQIILVNVQREG